MKRLLPAIPAVACLALSGCGGSAAPAPAPVPVAPAATAPPPAAVATPVPVAAAPAMPSAPKPEAKTRPQSREESSSAPSISGQTPSQIVNSIASQIRATDGEDALLRLELELTQKMYQYQELAGSINISMDDVRLATKMEAMMEKLAAACQGKRIGNPAWGDYIRAAEYIAGVAETEIRNANNPAAQQKEVEDWSQRIKAEKARNGGRRY